MMGMAWPYLEVVDKDNGDFSLPGVWVLVGRKDNQWYSLNVGMTTNILKEVEIDKYRLSKHKQDRRDFINQFGEFVFSMPYYPDDKQLLYLEIAKEYKDLAFLCVAKGEDLDEPKRKQIEKYVAYLTKAKYWRNGGSYKRETSVNLEDVIKGYGDAMSKEYKDLNSFMSIFGCEEHRERVRALIKDLGNRVQLFEGCFEN